MQAAVAAPETGWGSELWVEEETRRGAFYMEVVSVAVQATARCAVIASLINATSALVSLQLLRHLQMRHCSMTTTPHPPPPEELIGEDTVTNPRETEAGMKETKFSPEYICQSYFPPKDLYNERYNKLELQASQIHFPKEIMGRMANPATQVSPQAKRKRKRISSWAPYWKQQKWKMRQPLKRQSIFWSTTPQRFHDIWLSGRDAGGDAPSDGGAESREEGGAGGGRAPDDNKQTGAPTRKEEAKEGVGGGLKKIIFNVGERPSEEGVPGGDGGRRRGRRGRGRRAVKLSGLAKDLSEHWFPTEIPPLPYDFRRGLREEEEDGLPRTRLALGGGFPPAYEPYPQPPRTVPKQKSKNRKETEMTTVLAPHAEDSKQRSPSSGRRVPAWTSEDEEEDSDDQQMPASGCLPTAPARASRPPSTSSLAKSLSGVTWSGRAPSRRSPQTRYASPRFSRVPFFGEIPRGSRLADLEEDKGRRRADGEDEDEGRKNEKRQCGRSGGRGRDGDDCRAVTGAAAAGAEAAAGCSAACASDCKCGVIGACPTDSKVAGEKGGVPVEMTNTKAVSKGSSRKCSQRHGSSRRSEKGRLATTTALIAEPSPAEWRRTLFQTTRSTAEEEVATDEEEDDEEEYDDEDKEENEEEVSKKTGETGTRRRDRAREQNTAGSQLSSRRSGRSSSVRSDGGSEKTVGAASTTESRRKLQESRPSSRKISSIRKHKLPGHQSGDGMIGDVKAFRMSTRTGNTDGFRTPEDSYYELPGFNPKAVERLRRRGQASTVSYPVEGSSTKKGGMGEPRKSSRSSKLSESIADSNTDEETVGTSEKRKKGTKDEKKDSDAEGPTSSTSSAEVTNSLAGSTSASKGRREKAKLKGAASTASGPASRRGDASEDDDKASKTSSSRRISRGSHDSQTLKSTRTNVTLYGETATATSDGSIHADDLEGFEDEDGRKTAKGVAARRSSQRSRVPCAPCAPCAFAVPAARTGPSASAGNGSSSRPACTCTGDPSSNSRMPAPIAELAREWMKFRNAEDVGSWRPSEVDGLTADSPPMLRFVYFLQGQLQPTKAFSDARSSQKIVAQPPYSPRPSLQRPRSASPKDGVGESSCCRCCPSAGGRQGPLRPAISAEGLRGRNSSLRGPPPLPPLREEPASPRQQSPRQQSPCQLTSCPQSPCQQSPCPSRCTDVIPGSMAVNVSWTPLDGSQNPTGHRLRGGGDNGCASEVISSESLSTAEQKLASESETEQEEAAAVFTFSGCEAIFQQEIGSDEVFNDSVIMNQNQLRKRESKILRV